MTHRDAWAGSFHELLTLDSPRTDAPMHLPDAPLTHEVREHRRLQRAFAETEAASAVAGVPSPRHCSANMGPISVCAAEDGVTTKQKNQMRWFASMTHTAVPSPAELGRMSKEEAGRWIHGRWTAWVRHGRKSP